MLMACAVAVSIYYFAFSSNTKKEEANTTVQITSSQSADSIDLTQSQLETIKIEPLLSRDFRQEVEAVGSVVYHEKEINQENVSAHKDSRFIVANIHESDSMRVHVGQIVKAKMPAYPDREFEGKITTLGVTVYDSGGNPALDPSTHRITARCEINDPKNELYPGMLANVVIELEVAKESVAMPQSGVVREGDGTLTAWVTKDRHSFARRIIKIGIQQDGFDEVTEGLKAGELVATDGALFIDNALSDSAQ